MKILYPILILCFSCLVQYICNDYFNNPSVLTALLKGLSVMILSVLFYLWMICINVKFKFIGLCGFVLLNLANFCNTAIVVINNGYMPVLPELYDKVTNPPIYYIRGGELLFMGDCYFDSGASVGDIVLFLATPFIGLFAIFNGIQKVKEIINKFKMLK